MTTYLRTIGPSCWPVYEVDAWVSIYNRSSTHISSLISNYSTGIDDDRLLRILTSRPAASCSFQLIDIFTWYARLPWLLYISSILSRVGSASIWAPTATLLRSCHGSRTSSLRLGSSSVQLGSLSWPIYPFLVCPATNLALDDGYSTELGIADLRLAGDQMSIGPLSLGRSRSRFSSH